MVAITQEPVSECTEPLLRAGMLYRLIQLMSAAALVAILLAYLVGVELLGVFLGWSLYLNLRGLLAAAFELPLAAVCNVAVLGVATAGWVMMLRPLLPVMRRRPSAAMNVTANTQPLLFEWLRRICGELRCALPVEVWLDCSASVRLSVRGGFRGIVADQTILSIGMPAISALSAREVAAVLAGEISLATAGIDGRIARLFRTVDDWFQRPCHRRDFRKRDSNRFRVEDEMTRFKTLRGVVRFFAWLSQLPFWLAMILARTAALPAMRLMQNRANQCTSRLIGADGLALLLHKQQLLRSALGKARDELESQIQRSRLPENFVLVVSRHFLQALNADPPPLPRQPQAGAPLHSRLLESLPPEADGIGLIRDFVGLARQLSQWFYQRDSGIEIHKYRIVATDEIAFHDRHHVGALVAIRRYFGGLMHPERSLCGLALTPSRFQGACGLIQDVRRCRQWERRYGEPLKSALRDWNAAWRHRRDLEAAWVMSLAGIQVCRMEVVTLGRSAEVFRNEAAKQKMIMDHLDEPLKICEAWLERRLTAALGLLWWAPPDSLPRDLEDIRRRIPLWASMHEALSNVLVDFRELLTGYHSFQSLGAKAGAVFDAGAHATALQAVVPVMMARCCGILKALDGAMYPFASDGRVISLPRHLMPGDHAWLDANTLTGLGMHERARLMAAAAARDIGPFIERFLDLYHRSLGWLALAAERAEGYFVGNDESDVESEELTAAGDSTRPAVAVRD